MAESSLHDVALNTQSVGDDSPSDAPATTTDNQAIGGDVEEGILAKENGNDVQNHSSLAVDDQTLEDGATRSDTDTSRANSVTGDGKAFDSRSVKKFVASKPTSFAKYSLPKTIAANAPPKVIVDKAPAPVASNTSLTPLGRPRLVAKTNSSNQQKLSTYKPVAPDPMQVWNKNRATPQQSTKHLTDEELKQQYGIHLTSRLQSDNDGKEAKWADIDDDEDDWAPETIEWNDGTKTTVNPAESVPVKPDGIIKAIIPDTATSPAAPKPVSPSYSTSIGPNAIVLKIGANVERQQAQRALSQQTKGSTEKSSALGSKGSPAPTPVKSPWAKLPEIEKVSPVAINPQPVLQTTSRLPPPGKETPVPASSALSPAKEMSADDFNRSWRDSPASQTKELFMPSSGRYEAVSDGKRRMSKNEQNFRAPAVLQRPGQRDARAPAEPSAAFQTSRNSIDQGRRRASSSISGSSGQFARRMSFKSADTINLPQPDVPMQQPDVPSQQPPSGDGPSSQVQTPVQTPNTYQARGLDDVSAVPEAPTDADLETQRAAQKALMREKIEKARQRKIDEEAKLEAEKQERIRLKLASLGPPPEPPKPKQEDVSKEQAAEESSAATTATSISTTTTLVQSPPKPPQPLQTGEPQQYGMMKVHPPDNVKKPSLPVGQAAHVPKSGAETLDVSQQSSYDKVKVPSPPFNGARPQLDSPRTVSEEITKAEPSPKFAKPIGPLGSDARVGWSSARNDHRSQPSNNLWGLPNNKALGNGTFDSSLAGYSPQDLSRTSSTGQAWINGRTPTVGQSPQLNHVNHHVPETRSHLLQSMTSPDSQLLSLNSEIDPVLPTSRPAPIGRPHTQPPQNNVNGVANHNPANSIAAWSNFGNVARVQEKAETEKLNREFNERREEEKRTGVRQQAPYNFNETFKQVQLGDQVGQRHVSHVTQTSHSPNSMFGAVGSLPPADVPPRVLNGQYGQLGRGSRFFPPQQMPHAYPLERRAVTYNHPGIQRTPSPPPAEEYASYHPAFDGDFHHPKVQFPREKAVVRLPPAVPLPPSPVKEPSAPPQAKAPLTWAARVSMPAPVPVPVRAVSTPLSQHPSWQERINGLFSPKLPGGSRMLPAPALASSREPLDIVPRTALASVSLPFLASRIEEIDVTDEIAMHDAGKVSSKDVEDEEDLFEDREAGSLPTIHLPRDSIALKYPLPSLPRIQPTAVEPNSIHMFMVSNWSERYGYAKPQYAVIKAPGSNGKGIKRDLPARNGSVTPLPPRARSTYQTTTKHHSRPKPGAKTRVVSKTH